MAGVEEVIASDLPFKKAVKQAFPKLEDMVLSKGCQKTWKMAKICDHSLVLAPCTTCTRVLPQGQVVGSHKRYAS